MGMEMGNYECGAGVEYVSDVTDTEESDEECAVWVSGSFECGVPRRSVKRTYGVFVDGAGGVGASYGGRKRGRIDEQLEHLRAAIPSLCTNEQESVLVGAYEYIEKLQRQVQELSDELEAESPCSDDDDEEEEEEDDEGEDEEEDDGGELSSCEDAPAVNFNAGLEASHGESCGWLRPMVEVVRTGEGALTIHIQCVNRPRVLADIMEMLESGGMTMDQVSIGYHEDSQFVLSCVGSEVDEHGIAVDCGHVEACLNSLIAGECDMAAPLAAHVRSVWGDHSSS